MTDDHNPGPGDVVIGGDGRPWKVHCAYEGTLGLVPLCPWEQLKWWFVLRFL